MGPILRLEVRRYPVRHDLPSAGTTQPTTRRAPALYQSVGRTSALLDKNANVRHGILVR